MAGDVTPLWETLLDGLNISKVENHCHRHRHWNQTMSIGPYTGLTCFGDQFSPRQCTMMMIMKTDVLI